jgi:hypothetical protein
MKITLAEFWAFAQQTSDDWYFEGDECFVDPEFWDGKFNPAEVIDVKQDDITLGYQGRKELSEGEKYKDFLPEFRKWKGTIDFEYISFKIPKGMKEEISILVKKYLKEKSK